VSHRQSSVRVALVHNELSFDDVDGYVDPELDVLSFNLDSFIGHLVHDTSSFHDFVSFINERPIFYNILNIKAIEIFELSMLPMSESGVRVTKEHVIGQL
jgi:hypothetical protein